VVHPVGELTSSVCAELNKVEEQPWVKTPGLNFVSVNRQKPPSAETSINVGMQINQNTSCGFVAAIVDKYRNTQILSNQGVFAVLHHVKPISKHEIK